MTAKVIYTGELRTLATHTNSGTEIETDAPLDNKGKGERFSPTDLVAVALATCILTTIGILAPQIDILGAECSVEKKMVSNPRKIGEIVINFTFPKGQKYTEQEQERLAEIARTCPVHQTLHPDCIRTINFNW